MTWPLSQDYNEAIQSPGGNFSDPDLQGSEAVTNTLGIPLPCSGNFADVYQMHGRGGERWAVKCFTREVPGLRERYAAISRHLHDVNLPFVVDFTFLEQGIRVQGRWYPILKMQWVEGLTLNEFVRQYADKPAMLNNLLQIWVRMAARLRAAEIAHADLQHGNVLLVPGIVANALAVKLIDYDGMWVPALAGNPSGEVGHPSYQHPQRSAERTCSPEVDRFPLLLISTALSCLQVGGKALWDKYDTGDNLLFRETDLRAPVKSPLFYELLKLSDPQALRLVWEMLDALKNRLDAVPLLEELLPELHVPVASKPTKPAMSKRASGIRSAATQSVTIAQPAAQPIATSSASPLDFRDENEPLGRRLRKRGRRRWVPGAIAGSVAVLVLAGSVFILANRNKTEGQKDKTQIARNETEKPKQSSDPSPKKEPTKEKLSEGRGRQKDAPEISSSPAKAPEPRSEGGSPTKKPDREGQQARPKGKPAKPDDPQVHSERGMDLLQKGDVEGGIAELRRAIQLRNDSHQDHCNLGLALMRKGDFEGAIAESRQAIKLKEDCPTAHCNLGFALRSQGQFAEALAALRRGDELGRKNPQWREPSDKWVRSTEYMARLAERLPAIRKGEAPPTKPNDCWILSEICLGKRLYGLAARFAALAFKAKPALAEDLSSDRRYNAARAAALAGRGRGEDAAELDERDRARWRRQALAWLRADLELLRKQFRGADAKTTSQVRQTLRNWQKEPDLYGLRDEKALAALPEAERRDWRKLWEAVARFPEPTAEAPSAMSAAKAADKSYEKSCSAARAKLLKAFDSAIDRLSKRKGATEANRKWIETVKEEKQRFENKGWIPWSLPMRSHAEHYLAEIRTAEGKLRNTYKSLIAAQRQAKNERKAAELRADLENLAGAKIVAKWQHSVNGRPGGVNSFYSNGRINRVDSSETWEISNGVLKMTWPNPRAPGGAWIDTCIIAEDGARCIGKNKQGATITELYVKE